MQQKIVIAGGTGFIGQYLKKRFEEDGYVVVVLSRQMHHVSWEDKTAMIDAIDGSEMLINLAGKAINTRFTEENKLALINSRIHTTSLLGEVLLNCKNPPSVWFNASGAHIYGISDDKAHTEEDAVDHSFFPAIMAQKWEEALNRFKLPKTRKIALRISIVLGKDGGVLQPFIQLTKLFLGGKQGNGKQKFSWIHLEDFYQIIRYVAVNENIVGVINICSPEIVNNALLMQTLRRLMNRPLGLPAPAFAIKMGARLMGIESDLILKSLSVYPQKLLNAGYQFRYSTLKEALENLIK